MELVILIYLLLFIAGLVFVVITTLLGGLGEIGGAEGIDTDTGDIDAGGHEVHGTSGETVGLSPLSPMVVAISLTIFGAFGVIFKVAWPTIGDMLTVLFTLILTIVLTAGIYLVFLRIFVKTQASSIYKPLEAISVLAEVTTPIEPGKIGVVDYEIRGQRVSSSAKCKDECKLGETVKIVDIAGDVVIVEKIDKNEKKEGI